MAKKRVHELAKQYNMPTAEVMKRLNAAGIAVKAAASAVDETLADAALTGKKVPTNGAKPKQRAAHAAAPGRRSRHPRPRRPPARGHEAEAQAPARGQGRRRRRARAAATAAATATAATTARAVPPAPRSRASARPAPPAACAASSSTPRPPAARAAPAVPAAARAADPAAARQRRPPRRGGRRRRGTYTEPVPQDVSVLQADVIKVNSGSTVKDVAEYLGVADPRRSSRS